MPHVSNEYPLPANRAELHIGQMTKDLAALGGPDRPWLTTEAFLSALDKILAIRLGV